MSSPLSMLKKTRLTPLQGPNQQWGRGRYRGSLVTGFEDTLPEDDPSDLNPPPVVHTRPADAASTSKSKGSQRKGPPPSDSELMSSMVQRLTRLEAKVKSQAQEIERKDRKISVLKEELKLRKNSESARDLSDRDDLVKTCYQLQTQVYEMERFLSDYGMIWVGDGGTCDTAEGGEAEQTQRAERGLKPGTAVVRNFRMNFDLVLQSIKELNILAGEGESFVQATAQGAQLAKKDPVQLTLYSNGIIMFAGPFRSYQEHSTQQCMQDLMDGYFPSELQERFPDGVPFEVHDRRDEEFIVRRPWADFPGKGRAVDEAAEKGKSSSEIPGRRLSVDQFLNRLPKAVVKAGRMIDIRESVKASLQGSSDPRHVVILIDTPALQTVKERLKMSDSEGDLSARDVSTLKVKSEDGNHSFILKMHLWETIGHLRQYLDKHRGGSVSGYDIISVYPQRCCYSDHSQTLLSCGLTSNAALLLRTKQRAHSLTDASK